MRNIYLLLAVSLFFVFSSCEKDAGDDINDTKNDEETITSVKFPSTFIVINKDTMWMVSKTKLNDPYMYRYQINFGTKEQLQENVDEEGQNSTVGFSISFTEKPLKSAVFHFISNRFLTDNSDVNFYLSYFNNTGSPLENKNFLSPDEGELNIVISGSEFDCNIEPMLMWNEVDNTESIALKGTFDFEW